MLMMLMTGMFGLESGPQVIDTGTVVIELISIIFGLGYYAGLHASRYQATPGKMVVGIKVVRTKGERLTLWRSIARAFVMVFLGIGCFLAGVTERKRALHDMVCGALVVDKWAFTGKPKWQEKGLGIPAITILVMSGGLPMIRLILAP